MKDHIGSISGELPATSVQADISFEARHDLNIQPTFQNQLFDGIMNTEGLFDLGFDVSLPLMTDVCGTEDPFGQQYPI